MDFSKAVSPFTGIPSPGLGKIILIDGGIAAGKTTIGKYLERYLISTGLDAVFVEEYVNRDLLYKYISNMKEYAWAFQEHMVRARIEIYEMALRLRSEGKVVIIDRSLVGDMVFALLQLENKTITEEQWNDYLSILLQKNLPPPDLLVFLESNPVEALHRINLRKTDSTGYALEYVTKVETLHKSVTDKLTTFPVLKSSFMEDTMLSGCQTTIESAREFWSIIEREVSVVAN